MANLWWLEKVLNIGAEGAGRSTWHTNFPNICSHGALLVGFGLTVQDMVRTFYSRTSPGWGLNCRWNLASEQASPGSDPIEAVHRQSSAWPVALATLCLVPLEPQCSSPGGRRPKFHRAKSLREKAPHHQPVTSVKAGVGFQRGHLSFHEFQATSGCSPEYST